MRYRIPCQSGQNFRLWAMRIVCVLIRFSLHLHQSVLSVLVLRIQRQAHAMVTLVQRLLHNQIVNFICEASWARRCSIRFNKVVTRKIMQCSLTCQGTHRGFRASWIGLVNLWLIYWIVISMHLIFTSYFLHVILSNYSINMSIHHSSRQAVKLMEIKK